MENRIRRSSRKDVRGVCVCACVCERERESKREIGEKEICAQLFLNRNWLAAFFASRHFAVVVTVKATVNQNIA